MQSLSSYTQNLSLSDRIGQDATDVVFLNKEDSVMTFNIAKARDGCKQNVLTYQVNFNNCEWIYLPQEDDKLSKEYVEQNSGTFTPQSYTNFDDDLGDLPF